MDMCKVKPKIFPNRIKVTFYESSVSGAVTLSPSEIAQVCVGDDLEFTCNITGIVLEWTFPKLMSQRLFHNGIVAQGSAEDQTSELIDSNTTYRLSRTSAEGSPVSSMLIVSPVSDGHNGTDITCVDVESPTLESSSTTIVVIDSQIQGIMYLVAETRIG